MLFMPLVELRSVCKRYTQPGAGQSVSVLHNLSLTLEKGESVAIVGPSGCGKSTLLNIIGTLESADEGEVLLEGESLNNADSGRLAVLRSQKIGFIFQLHHLLPQCSVLENVLLPILAQRRADHSAARARAQQLLAHVGLAERMSWKPAQLSGGERQRTAVVRALINKPQLILADEPTGALDEASATTLTDLLISLQKETGVALVLVTHHPAQAARMQRTLTLKEGHLVT
jgi:ABC-type lipoprotein export system ATPase subunit